MKKIKAVALSDLHLGDTESLLYQDSKDKENIIDITIDKIAQLPDPKDGEKGNIDELILMGDIADLSEAKPKIAYDNLRIFLNKLLNKVNIGKIVYVVGNHDHHLWVELAEYSQKKKYSDCTKTNIIIQKEDTDFFKERFKDINANISFSYPNYIIQIDDPCATFFFHHGHFLSETVIEGMVNKERVKDLEDLENRATRDIELVWWYLKKLDPIKERFYDLIVRKAEYFFQKKSSRGTTFVEDSKPIADDYMLKTTAWYLVKVCGINLRQNEDFHLIFGHTHQGGRLLRDDRTLRIQGRFITVWNTGGWIVPTDIWSPDAYIFYIEERNENGKISLIPNSFKIVAFPEDTYYPNAEGDYDRSILYKRLSVIGK
ncbi:MAG: metallophosphoesterase [Candidatus Poribacteria bacterium]